MVNQEAGAEAGLAMGNQNRLAPQRQPDEMRLALENIMQLAEEANANAL